MSDVLITYKNQNKNNKYYILPSSEKASIDNVVTNFIQELVTDKGSSVFDREYGSTFIKDLGDHANVHKVDYLLKNSVSSLKEKYGIISVAVSDSNFNRSNGFLEIRLNIEMSNVAVETHFDFMYAGLYTEKTIVEMD